MPKTPEQKFMELEAQVKPLAKLKAFLEHQANVADKKVIIFDMIPCQPDKKLDTSVREFPNLCPYEQTSQKLE